MTILKIGISFQQFWLSRLVVVIALVVIEPKLLVSYNFVTCRYDEVLMKQDTADNKLVTCWSWTELPFHLKGPQPYMLDGTQSF
jgi:flagellar assembly factor FliW